MADTPRLDQWLVSHRGLSRSAAQTLCSANLVTVNGKVQRSSQRISEGDVVVILEDTKAPAPAQPETGPPVSLTVVYEDEWLAVIDKPWGMVVHPAPGHPHGTLADGLRQRGSLWSLAGGEERPGIVHRLDRDTSGLLVVAKTEGAHRALAAQLQDRTLGRVYWALVRGGLTEETGTIDAPIGRDPKDRKRMAIVDKGKPAVTDFTVLERFADTTLLDVHLRTGRTHQIRVHCAYIHHPVVGDPVYGPRRENAPRLALHARQMTFTHPNDGSVQTFTSALPEELQTLLATVREGGTV